MLSRCAPKILFAVRRSSYKAIVGSSYKNPKHQNQMEVKMFQEIADFCQLPSYEDSLSTNKAFTGRCLTSAMGQKAIKSFRHPSESTIQHVPLDARIYSHNLLLKSLSRPGVEGRYDLLSSAAYPGSGKTVVLWLNTFWFVNETGGIGIEITFNDNQATLFMGGNVNTPEKLAQAIAVRILHRVVEHVSNKNCADLLLRDNGSLVRIIQQQELSSPIDSALKVVRRILGASEDTKVLLCVDELSNALEKNDSSGAGSNFTMENALKMLTNQLDTDPTFFLAVSALRTDHLVAHSTGSNRHLLLQALGPLSFNDYSNPAVHKLLPEVLQPFHVETMRVALPFGKKDKAVYDKLAKLMVTAAGHPRRQEVLYRELGKFTTTDSSTLTELAAGCHVAGERFVREVEEWLHKKREWGETRFESIIKQVESIVAFPSDFTKLLIVSTTEAERDRLTDREAEVAVATALEKLAVYLACPFMMPNDAEDKGVLKTVLSGVASGYCQLVPTADAAETNLLAFVPWPVLNGSRGLPLKFLADRKLLGPCGEALCMLRDAITLIHKNKKSDQHQRGVVDFELVAVSSMLLFARCNKSFTLSQMCDAGLCGGDLGDVRLLGGPKVKVVSMPEIHSQTGAVTSDELQTLVNRLKEDDATGLIIRVTNVSNKPSEFYGLFQTSTGGYALFRVTASLWLTDQSRDSSNDIVTEWRKNADFCPSVLTLANGSSVPFASLLFSADKLQQKVEVQSFEGVITIAAMRTWLPTAAHALETLTYLRETFKWFDTASTAHDIEGTRSDV